MAKEERRERRAKRKKSRKKRLLGHRGNNRDYKREYKQYHGKPEQIANRSARNEANKEVSPAEGNVVDHKNGNPRDNREENLQEVSKEYNLKKGPLSLAEMRNKVAKDVAAKAKLA